MACERNEKLFETDIKLDFSIEIIVFCDAVDESLLQTAASLKAQTDSNFSVLLSVDASTVGTTVPNRFLEILRADGIVARQICPPINGNQIQRLNWTHGESTADWIKPLFSGDLLEADCIAIIRRLILKKPAAQIICITTEWANDSFQKEFTAPDEFVDCQMESFGWSGGLASLAYSRMAWISAGGYPVYLPHLGYLELAAAIGLRYGCERLAKPLVLYSQEQRRLGRRSTGCIEAFLLLNQLRNYCLSKKMPWPRFGVLRGVLRYILSGL